MPNQPQTEPKCYIHNRCIQKRAKWLYAQNNRLTKGEQE